MDDCDETTIPLSRAFAVEGMKDKIRVSPHEKASDGCQ